MKMLFSDTYENHVKFIFDFYDFDKDGKISREDIQIVLSYIPLNSTKERLSGYKLKFEK
jgi:Ca2+-binding EF-hand superfamily protein